MQSEWAFCYTLVKWGAMTVETEKLENYFFHPLSFSSQNQGPFFQNRGGWGVEGNERKINHWRMSSLCPFEVLFMYDDCGFKQT